MLLLLLLFTRARLSEGHTFLGGRVEIFKKLAMYILVFLTDVDECSNGTHNCDQLCINIIGGFSCSCEEGYMLTNDSISCKGTTDFYGEVDIHKLIL